MLLVKEKSIVVGINLRKFLVGFLFCRDKFHYSKQQTMENVDSAFVSVVLEVCSLSCSLSLSH
jgi:hypothetical protein